MAYAARTVAAGRSARMPAAIPITLIIPRTLQLIVQLASYQGGPPGVFPENAPGMTLIATLFGRWSNNDPFLGSFQFIPPNFSYGNAYSITMNPDNTGNLIINPFGPGVGGVPTIEHCTIWAVQ